jgi:hypothetical protein
VWTCPKKSKVDVDFAETLQDKYYGDKNNTADKHMKLPAMLNILVPCHNICRKQRRVERMTIILAATLCIVSVWLEILTIPVINQ